jgi:hypothetical protein
MIMPKSILLETFDRIFEYRQHEPFFAPADAVLKELLDNTRVRSTK